MRAEPPEITIVPLAYERKVVLRHLLQLYCYDFSELTGDDVNNYGLFRCVEYIDHYWTREGRYPFLIQVRDNVAGFVLVHAVTPASPDAVGATTGHTVAEFFVLRKYRRQGVGRAAAWQIFDRFPGRWSVDQFEANYPATAFWRSVIGDYTGGNFRDVRHLNGGPSQVFTTLQGSGE